MGDSTQELLHAAAEDLAYRDDLTGLFNHRLLTRLLTETWDCLLAKHGRVAVIMLDLDGFKAVNDTLGHLRGDAVLRSTARVLRRSFRGDDVVVRYGGDEFAVVLPGAGGEAAARLARRARAAMADLTAIGEEPGLEVSFSIGVAAAPEDGTQGLAVLETADRRLFVEKRSRRPITERIEIRSSRRAWWVAGALALALGGAGTLAVLARRGLPPSQVSPTPTPVTAVDAKSSREAELEAEIARLRRELETVTRRERAGEASVDAGIRAEEEQLAARIRSLEAQLAPGPPPAATDVPTPAEQQKPDPDPSPIVEGSTAIRQELALSESGDASSATVPVVEFPRLKRFTPPAYPEIALRLRYQADVKVAVRVGPDGHPLETRIVGPEGRFGLGEAAQQAALGAVFEPGTVNGAATTMETVLTVAFRLTWRK